MPGMLQGSIDLRARANSERIARLRSMTLYRRCRTLVAVVTSALLQAYVIQAFVQPADLLSSGFTGLAILIDRITSLFGLSFPTFAGMLALNVPVALACWKSISRRFVLFSMLQVFLASMFLRFLDFEPILTTTMLEVLFGGFLYGLSIAIALKGGASTAGTDFISLRVANATGKSIWGFIFAGNCCILVVFGALFGWTNAAYSIIFQFVSTKTIEAFYHRYDRVTMQIVTQHPKRVLAAYNERYRHGSSCFEGTGGYSGEPFWMITTVISMYEVEDVAHLVREQDERAVMNVLRTENFFGGFYRPPID